MKRIIIYSSAAFLLLATVAGASLWLQTDWSGLDNQTEPAVSPTNQTGWTKYYEKDATIAVTGGKLALTGITAGEFTQDDWSGGPGQADATDATMFYTADDNAVYSTAGEISLAMNQLWWDEDWAYRYNMTVTNQLADLAIPGDYSVSITFDHSALVNDGVSLATGDDVRIFYQTSSIFEEIPRWAETGWGVAGTKIWFKLYQPIAAGGTDANYYFYFGNLEAPPRPDDPQNVFLFFDDFDAGYLDPIRWSSTGAPTVDGGMLSILANGDSVTSLSTFYPEGAESIKMDYQGYFEVNGLAVTHTAVGGLAFSDLSDPRIICGAFAVSGSPQSAIDASFGSFTLLYDEIADYSMIWGVDLVSFYSNGAAQAGFDLGIPIGVSLPVTFARPDENGVDGNDTILRCDSVMVRKYIVSEPVVSKGSIEGFFTNIAELTSSTYEIPENSALDTVSWALAEENANFGEAPVQFQFAVSDDGAEWNFVGPDGAADMAFSGSAAGVMLDESLSGYKYFRYKLILSTADTTMTPVLGWVKVSYRTPYVSTLTSTPFNSGIANNGIQKLQWSESLYDGSDIRFQLRTAPDMSGTPGEWTEWMGPTGVDDYYTDDMGLAQINGIHANGVDDQWFQYKALLSATSADSPLLHDVTVTFPKSTPMASPYITSVAPDTVSVDGGSVIAVIGGNFQTGSSVRVDATEVTEHTWTGTAITFTAPAGTAGTAYDVTVINPDGGTNTMIDALHYSAVGSLGASLSAKTSLYRNESVSAANIPALLLVLSAGAAEGMTVSSIKLTAYGTGDDIAALSANGVAIYEDTVSNGTYDTGDRLIGQGVFSADNGTVDFTGLTEHIAAASAVEYLVTLSLNGTAAVGQTFSVRFSDNTHVSASGDTSGTEILPYGAPLQGSVITVVEPATGGTLTVLKGYKSPASTSITNSQQLLPMIQLSFNASSVENISISSLTLTSSGFGNDQFDIATVKIFKDVNANGALDSGIDIVIDDSGKAFGSDDGTAIFTGLNQTIPAGQTVYWIVTCDMSSKASNGDTFAVSVAENSDITATGAASSLAMPVSTMPIYGETMTVYMEEHSRTVKPKTCFLSEMLRR